MTIKGNLLTFFFQSSVCVQQCLFTCVEGGNGYPPLTQAFFSDISHICAEKGR